MSKFAGLRKPVEASAAISEIQPFDNAKSQPSKTTAELSHTKKLGRPPAKRSDPAFRQVTCYVRKDTYKTVRTKLLDQDREFSELVQDLLTGWLTHS